jgi:serine/threonine-protein kinase
MLLDVAGRRQAAEATVEGPTDSLLALVDRLATKVLLLRAGEEQQRVASLTTNSLPALRAYLEAHAAYRRGQYADATRQFHQAVMLDSTFALAGIQLFTAAGWYGSEESRELGYRVASRHRDRLSQQDRLLLDASNPNIESSPSTAERLRAAERYTELVPDSRDGWQILGDALYHYGPLLGLEQSLPRAQAAIERALELDSAFVPALTHLPNIYGLAGDTAALRRTMTRLLAVDSTGDGVDGLRWYSAMRLGDSAQVRMLRARFDQFNPPNMAQVFIAALDENIGLGDARRLLERLGDRPVSAEERFGDFYLRMMLALDRGRPFEAASWAARMQLNPAARIQHLLAWDGDSADGAAAAQELAELERQPVEMAADRVTYALSLFTLAEYDLSRGETARPRRILKRLVTLPIPGDSAWLRRKPQVAAWILEAQLAALNKRPDARALIERADSALRAIGDHLRLVALGNLIVARLWESQGDIPRALAATRRRARGLGYPMFNATMHREEGRLSDLAGDRSGAIEAYSRYLKLRSDPEPSLEPEVARIRAEMVRLAREEASAGAVPSSQPH